MPTYTYRCSECGSFDWMHSIHSVITECPKCGGKDFAKAYHPAGISFKGSGFYSTDNRGK
jgi:putative FmdB family regulatory protein